MPRTKIFSQAKILDRQFVVYMLDRSLQNDIHHQCLSDCNIYIVDQVEK